MKPSLPSRREFLRHSLLGSLALATGARLSAASDSDLTIGLSQYSLRALFASKQLDPLDYPAFARKEFGLTELDLWEGGLPPDRLDDDSYLSDLRRRAKDAGTHLFLLMAGVVDATDGTGKAPKKAKPADHLRSIERCAVLGCQYVRFFVSASAGERAAAVARCAEALAPLADRAKASGIAIAIEPGASTHTQDGAFLAEIMQQLRHSHCRLMPDCMKPPRVESQTGPFPGACSALFCDSTSPVREAVAWLGCPGACSGVAKRRASVHSRYFVRTMTKIHPLSCALWLAMALSCLLAEAASVNQPNVIFIVSDDQGYGELGCQPHQGAPVNTPHLDRLAREGVRFTQAYANGHVCAPSRAAFLTGRYPHRFGFHGNGDAEPGMPRTEKLLPAYFKAAGYATAAIGKWHLGWAADRHPQQFGFDEFFGFLGGEHSYFDARKGHAGIGTAGSQGDAPILDGTKPVEKIKYLTEEFTDRAIGFVRRHAAKPFCLYLAYNAVHTPMEVTEEYLARNGGDHRRAMVEALDANLGRLFALLRELGLERNTLVVFFGDNGGARGADNGPLRGFKGSYFEGGIRVPAIWRWPERIPGGRVCDVPVMGLDVLPTLLAAAGLAPDRALDGVNLLPLATGGTTAPPRAVMHWLLGANHAVRRGDLKYVRQDREDFLFDLAADPGEAANLATKSPVLVSELRGLHAAWVAGLPPRLADPAKPARKAAPATR